MAILSLPSWPKTLLLVYLVANIKSLPFAWHIRILYQLLTNISRTPIPPKPLPSSTAADRGRRRILAHPLFAPVQITTHTPLLEIDYNLHKSNCTYFSDLDVSRTQLVVRLFSPGFRKLKIQLQEEGYKGSMVVMLGGVHMSFRREMAVYERVRIQSRVLTWDGKWLVIMSCFLKAERDPRREGRGEVLCAVGLSKYVVKKGRFTVRPGRVLRVAGWLPEKSAGDELEKSEESNEVEGAERASETENKESCASSAGRAEGRLPGAEDEVIGVRSAQIPDLAERVVLDDNSAAAATVAANAFSAGESGKAVWNAEAWSWEEIEGERLRGLKVASKWLAIDAELCDEFERN